MEENNNAKNEVEELDINHLMQIRRDKLAELQQEGKNPYEVTKFNRSNTAGEIKNQYEQFEQKDVTVCRKNYCKKNHGESIFLHDSR